MKEFKKWFYSLGKSIETFIFYSRKDWQNVVLLDYEKMIVIGIIPTMGYSTEETNAFFVKQKLEDYLKWNTKLDSEYYDCVYRGIIMYMKRRINEKYKKTNFKDVKRRVSI